MFVTNQLLHIKLTHISFLCSTSWQYLFFCLFCTACSSPASSESWWGLPTPSLCHTSSQLPLSWALLPNLFLSSYWPVCSLLTTRATHHQCTKGLFHSIYTYINKPNFKNRRKSQNHAIYSILFYCGTSIRLLPSRPFTPSCPLLNAFT